MGDNFSRVSVSKQIKTILLASLSAIVVLHLFSSLPGLYRTVKILQNARRVAFLNDVSDALFTAVGNYGFERGRVNVVLNDSGPVAKMEKNRHFIIERRKEGDNALSQAFEKLSSATLPGLSEKILQVKQSRKKIDELRQKTANDLVLNKNEREKGLAKVWFSAMTNYIESIEALLVTISIDISNSDGMISRYFSLKHETLALRNTAGPEMSILSATILSGEPIEKGLQKKIEHLHVITNQHFHAISFLCRGLSSPVIPEALKKLKQLYSSGYLPYRNEIFPLAQTGGPYPYSQEEFLDHGVKTLNEIAVFMDVIVSETKTYASMKLNQCWRQILFHCFGSTGSLLALILVMFYVNAKVILPIGRLTSSLRKLAKKELDVEIPLLNQKNEIGEMARSLAIFRQTSIQLDRDNRLLQVAEAKIRMSEEKLKRILNSIPDMIIECDADLNVLWANKAALEMNPEAIGQVCYAAFPGNDRICDGCYCKKALETGKIETGVMYQPASKISGESYWENIGIPLKNSSDKVLTVLEMSRNVTERIQAEAEKERLIVELQNALKEIKTLSGLLPICSHCKKIRDDQGYWNSIESYIHEHSDAEFSHGICQECAKKYYPDMDLYGNE